MGQISCQSRHTCHFGHNFCFDIYIKTSGVSLLFMYFKSILIELSRSIRTDVIDNLTEHYFYCNNYIVNYIKMIVKKYADFTTLVEDIYGCYGQRFWTTSSIYS